MTRKKRRALVIFSGLALLGAVVAFALYLLQDKATYFRSPSDLVDNPALKGVHVRLGGLVQQHTYQRKPDGSVVFTVTDGSKSLPVTYNDILPDLFREGQGVVTEGELGPDGVFIASKVLAKHDEKYMPPEVAAALKKSGRWQEQGAKPNGAPGS